MEVNLSQVGRNFAELTNNENVLNTDVKTQTNVPLPDVKSASDINNKDTKGFTATADKQVQEDRELSTQELDEALLEVNEFVQTRNKQLNFSVDEDSGKQVVKVTDSESGDVIRQIPTEEVLSLSRRIQDLQMDVGSAVGMFFNKQA
ncbi:flagellar protein FlaG protein [Paraglaciecola sp. T6c]|uniref:flagellar protein FlaG n=1 Tax=Pseudoalteromonas atlantica (strain T6c / ATCC BAA-1087) TaxID=3042615 RepID=UPI00005C679E|nr:flagellar protein FlaG [Paraglaciecola sp. T6c]ABG41590.1 flagellar protein FlaG protein [Paraglaciecola sp. T6c]